MMSIFSTLHPTLPAFHVCRDQSFPGMLSICKENENSQPLTLSSPFPVSVTCLGNEVAKESQVSWGGTKILRNYNPSPVTTIFKCVGIRVFRESQMSGTRMVMRKGISSLPPLHHLLPGRLVSRAKGSNFLGKIEIRALEREFPGVFPVALQRLITVDMCMFVFFLSRKSRF